MDESNTCRVELTQGRFALVDAIDFERLAMHKWHITGKRMPYAARWVKEKPHSLLMHRLIIDAPDDMMVDHINGDTLDNRRCNLRLATRAENLRNQKKTRGSSKYHGVYRVRANRYRAAIAADGKKYCLGTYLDEIAAAKAYDEASRRLHGVFGVQNFPSP